MLSNCIPFFISIISDLYAEDERATAMAIFGLGVNFGIMLGFVIGGWVNEWVGWRWAFVVAAVPGLIIALMVRFTMVEPPRGYVDAIEEKPDAPPFWAVVATMWRSAIMRHLLGANILISFAGYAAIAWAPVYFQRVHGMGTGESGTWLALMIGLGGGLGTFLAGHYADKLGKRDLRWRAWVVCAAIVVYIPMAVLAFMADTKASALFWFLGPAALGGAYIGVNFALMQSLLAIEMRSVGAAINLFLLNIVGLGLGPLVVGMISDLMAPTAGIDSVRYGLLFTVFVITWGALHQFRVGQLLK